MLNIQNFSNNKTEKTSIIRILNVYINNLKVVKIFKKNK